MNLFNLARHPTRAIRIALVTLLLALGLNAVAHAGHHHVDDFVGASTSVQHSGSCGYCATFGTLGDAPSSYVLSLSTQFLSFVATTFVTVAIVRRIATSAIPRGPPRF